MMIHVTICYHMLSLISVLGGNPLKVDICSQFQSQDQWLVCAPHHFPAMRPRTDGPTVLKVWGSKDLGRCWGQSAMRPSLGHGYPKSGERIDASKQ